MLIYYVEYVFGYSPKKTSIEVDELRLHTCTCTAARGQRVKRSCLCTSSCRSATLKAQASNVVAFWYGNFTLAVVAAHHGRTLARRAVRTELDILTRFGHRVAADAAAEQATGYCTLLHVWR